ncbi:MAG: hypothetical protein JNK92_09230 [Dechloromonas sp.]|nr:hypothetical protein [Dechloromonas sp.]
MSRHGRHAPSREIHRARYRQPEQHQPGAGGEHRIIAEFCDAALPYRPLA